MPAVECGKFVLTQPFGDRENRGVHKPDIEIRVPIKDLGDSPVIGVNQILNMKRSLRDISEERHHRTSAAFSMGRIACKMSAISVREFDLRQPAPKRRFCPTSRFPGTKVWDDILPPSLRVPAEPPPRKKGPAPTRSLECGRGFPGRPLWWCESCHHYAYASVTCHALNGTTRRDRGQGGETGVGSVMAGRLDEKFPLDLTP